uniref:S49 family peptidase n=1 Tax=Pararhizobium sp. IMCC3301 TaxID=3067904 RepID=UPI0027422DB9|nr:S49 family peptidase [Pararhizobium sp. IMCC3301]
MFTAFKNRIRVYLPEKYRTPPPVVPVIRLSGVIASGSHLRPGLNLAAIAPALEKAFSYKDAPAVAIVVNSPGGSPVQSNLIFQRIRQLAEEKEKTVLVFVEDVAASGGYFIAVAGDEIIADPSSVVGSIGVISASFGLNKAISKLGVERRVYTSGKSKSTLDPFLPEKKEDVAHLKQLQEEIHETFIDVVKSRRADVLKEDDETLFNGLFWTGKTALSLGLIDGIGEIRSTLKERYGEKTRLKLIDTKKGFSMRRLFGGTSQDNLARQLSDGLVGSLEDRALWARFGL